MNVLATVFTIIIGLLALTVSWFFSRQLFAMRKGKYFVAKNSKEYLSISSDFGNFHFNFNEKTFFTNNKTISIGEIVGVRYIVDDELALYSERYSFKGSADLNNVIHWYTIKLILKDRTEVPIFIAGEYEPKDWFGGYASQLQTSFYQKLGLVVDVDGHCRKALDTLLKCFKNSGHELPLV
jgi:hypothetical protein